MINSSFKGKINNKKTALKLSISIDSKSKITQTGDSYYTSLTNEESSGKNMDKIHIYSVNMRQMIVKLQIEV